MNRKDDHINYALAQESAHNDFDEIRFVHHSLPGVDVEDVDISLTIDDFTFVYPIYINAMTGGTERAYEINKRLAKLANALNIPMASGSVSQALKEPKYSDSYKVIREVNQGLVFSNIGAGKSVEDALKAIDLLNADALQIHINSAQELVMPEGDRVFSNWLELIKDIVKVSPVPVIAKEVGFGMSKETITQLKNVGIKIVDVSGRGGTNFIKIENARRDVPMNYLDNYGLSTVESLLEARSLSGLTILASGGIRNPFDVVKAIALGAKAVGLSNYFLKLVHNNNHLEALDKMETFIKEIKKIMALLGCKTLNDLRHKEILFSERLLSYMKQRNITY